MATDEILRLHYYERQYLGAADMEAEQEYLRDMRRRHNLGPHTWGIVTGLMLVEEPVAGDPTAVDVFLQPGVAIDGFGREIVVMAPTKLDPQKFESFANQQHRSVWIAFRQELTTKANGGYASCKGTDQYGRVQETFDIVVDPVQPTQQDPIVDGKSENPTSTDLPQNPNYIDTAIPVDESVPYQELPNDDDDPEWLMPLGWVNWDGTQTKFIPASPSSRLTDDRLYAGVVARTIYGAEPTLKTPDPTTDEPRLLIQPRGLPANTSAYDFDGAEFAEILGRLRVDGRIVAKKDVQLHGGKLDFKDTGGGDANTPLWMQRTVGTGGVGTDLRVHIGDDATAAGTRLSVGPKSGADEKAVLAVKADDTVDIPTGSLNFGAHLGAMINLWNKNYAIGIQPGTQYYRSDGAFNWYRGGSHSDTANDPGGGGTLQLSLDASANLKFGSTRRQMLNLWDTSYGIGIQDWTWYARSAADFCWFRGGAHADGRSDPGGGTLAMKLDSNSKLSVMGDVSISGNLSVTGSNNIIKVFQKTLALKNTGSGSTSWTVPFPWSFLETPVAFVAMQGFSLWNNDGNTAFTNFGNVSDSDAIPQHAYVIIDSVTTTGISGHCFCSESKASNENDNTVLFTVVAMGRPA